MLAATTCSIPGLPPVARVRCMEFAQRPAPVQSWHMRPRSAATLDVYTDPTT
ncbi:hypothetical protein C8Q73DRAFT_718165 [Cubamyces lactineus]|nr:hypothetical protein C8Q73DRAFT_718165 [Cubamyces lactineus]